MGKKSFTNEETGQDFLVDEANTDRIDKLTSKGFVPSNLDAGMLTPAPTSVFNDTPVIPPTDITKLDIPELTSTEEVTQGFGEDIIALNKRLSGEADFRTQQEEEFGLPDLTATQTDLQSRIKGLVAEQKVIPLQLQQESIGRGRTAGGIEPLQTSRLRNNAINALTTGALLEATKGNILTAQDGVERAVREEFGQAKAEKEAIIANLKIIKDSPLYTLEQKARADTELKKQEAEKKEIEKQEADKKAILDTATQVAKFGASAEAVQAIRDAETPLDAMFLAQQTGVFDVEQEQQGFENSLKTDEFNLKKYKIEQDIEQQAVDNEISIMSYELNRDKYTSDTEFRNAQLVLDKMKANYSVAKIQADIDKIYDEMEDKDEPLSEIEQLKADMLQIELNKKKAEIEKEQNASGAEVATLKSKISLIDEILKNKTGLKNVVGTNFLGRLGLDPFSGNSQFVSGKVRQLVDKEVLDTLIGLKARGGTLGAISEKELEILGNASTAINGWATKSGKRWNISEDEFKKELKAIRESAQRLVDADNEDQKNRIEAGGFKDYNDFLDYGTEEQIQFVEQLQNEYGGITDGEILDILNEDLGKTNVGSDTNEATGDITSLGIGGRNIKVDSSIKDKLALADKLMFEETGQHIKVNQSFRSREQQAELYRRSQAGEIGRASPPGFSFHEKGLAIDVSNWSEAEEYLRSVGLINELSDDKGHFSFGEFA